MADRLSVGTHAYVRYERVAGTRVHDLQSREVMHVLILPSEEFVPADVPLAGIFQYHQAMILHQAGYRVGVISIRQSFSAPMLAKGIAYKLAGKKARNATDKYSVGELLKLAYRKIIKPAYFLQTEHRDGLPVFRIDGFYYKPPIDNKNHFGWIQAGLTAFKKYVEAYGRPDIVHAHNAIYAGMLAQKIKQRYGISYVLTEHSTAFARKAINDRKVLQKVKNVYDKSLALTAVSEPFCSLLNETFALERFHCLPNVLDPSFETKEYKAEFKKEEGFVFLNIAELHPKKDHITLIKAFKKIASADSHARLWIGGDGILSNELKRLVASENLQQAVTFLGLLDRQQVADRLMHSDCFVLSSKFETFGVVVIEAMLFGKPVIVTRCGGPESFVTPEVGVVVERENEQQLADAMVAMIAQQAAYHSHTIQKFALENFGRQKFLERVHELYGEATGNAAVRVETKESAVSQP